MKVTARIEYLSNRMIKLVKEIRMICGTFLNRTRNSRTVTHHHPAISFLVDPSHSLSARKLIRPDNMDILRTVRCGPTTL
jgi:hypothetical protein